MVLSNLINTFVVLENVELPINNVPKKELVITFIPKRGVDAGRGTDGYRPSFRTSSSTVRP
jgi:hypothetical protein